MLDWTPYLNSIRDTYAQWWQVYTFTDVVGERPEGDRASEVPLLDLGLMVETRVPSDKGEPDEGRLGEEEPKKIERLGVLEGLRKYALDSDQRHVLLVGRPGSGKSTALLRMLLEEARLCAGDVGDRVDTSRIDDPSSGLPPSSPPASFGHAARKPRGEAPVLPLTKGELEGVRPLELTTETLANQDLKIPVLVELRYWQTSTLELIRRFLLRHRIALSHSEVEQQLAQGRFLLLIDGINELPSEAARRNVKAFRQDYPRTPMVFTTRELGLGGDLEITQRLEMQPLSDEQMRQFVLRYLP
ncbi:MAG: NACHT domain-containing protein, partial [Elainellaceae cyanobacterium]